MQGAQEKVKKRFSSTRLKIKGPRPLRAALDRERFLVTDKHTEILDCILCVVGQTVQKLERKQTDGQTDERTDASKCIISLVSWSINIRYNLCHKS